ncbi:MAG TPA: hypothetical protein VFO31_18030, partial [Vicinamibacterales bacterium]|nr:hypothetical protein [Vicinamibacterales bacterium]
AQQDLAAQDAQIAALNGQIATLQNQLTQCQANCPVQPPPPVPTATLSAAQISTELGNIRVRWDNVSNFALTDRIEVWAPNATAKSDSFTLGSPPPHVTIEFLASSGSLKYASWTDPALTYEFRYYQGTTLVARSALVTIVKWTADPTPPPPVPGCASVAVLPVPVATVFSTNACTTATMDFGTLREQGGPWPGAIDLPTGTTITSITAPPPFYAIETKPGFLTPATAPVRIVVYMSPRRCFETAPTVCPNPSSGSWQKQVVVATSAGTVTVPVTGAMEALTAQATVTPIPDTLYLRSGGPVYESSNWAPTRTPQEQPITLQLYVNGARVGSPVPPAWHEVWMHPVFYAHAVPWPLTGLADGDYAVQFEVVMPDTDPWTGQVIGTKRAMTAPQTWRLSRGTNTLTKVTP